MLAAADRGRGQHLSLEIFHRAILGPADQPKNWPTKTDGHHAQGGAALDRPDGAADGTQTVQLSGYPSGDRRIRRHLNQQGFQSLLLEEFLFLGDKKLNGGNPAARIADGYL